MSSVAQNVIHRRLPPASHIALEARKYRTSIRTRTKKLPEHIAIYAPMAQSVPAGFLTQNASNMMESFIAS